MKIRLHNFSLRNTQSKNVLCQTVGAECATEFEYIRDFRPHPPRNVAEANVLQGCCTTSLKNVGLINALFKLRA